MTEFTTENSSKSYKAWNLIFCSGQIALSSTTMKLIEWWITKQTRQVCKNLGEVLREHKLWLQNVVKTTIFLTNLDNFDKVNAVYKDYFIFKPATSIIQVSALPKWALIQIEAVAEIK